MKGLELSKEVKKLRDDAIEILSSTIDKLKKSICDEMVGIFVTLTSN